MAPKLGPRGGKRPNRNGKPRKPPSVTISAPPRPGLRSATNPEAAALFAEKPSPAESVSPPPLADRPSSLGMLPGGITASIAPPGLPPSGAPPTPPRTGLQGRPTVYTQELGDEILTRLASGEMVYQVCADPRMPYEHTVLRWQEDDTPPGFRDAYHHARRLQAEGMAEKNTAQVLGMIRGERIPKLDPATGRQALDPDSGAPLWEIRKPDAKGAEVWQKTMAWYLGVTHKQRFGAKAELTITDPAAAKSALARLLGVDPSQLPEE